MKINTLKLVNFRGFEERKFSFYENFTLLLGDNGAGKTAVLDALSISASSLFLGFDGMNERPIQDKDARRVSHVYGDVVSIEPMYPVSIEAEGVVADRQIRWKRTLNGKGGRTTRREAEPITHISAEFQHAVKQGKEVILPVIAYYGMGRLWLQKKEKFSPLPPASRLEGYQDCFDPASNEKMLTRWLKAREYEAIQHEKALSLYEAVKKAITNCCIEECRKIWYDVRFDSLMLELSDGRHLPAHLLSDGYRNMLAMVADIAYRMALLNPHLGPEVTCKTPGIVLIDEIDLHLHPKWQRRVVEDLKRTFPRLQIIATTHSPFIVQSLRPGELIDLDKEITFEYADRSIEDIAEVIMGVDMPQKSRRYLEMMEVAKEYYRLLEEGKSAETDKELKKIKDKLDELLIPYGDNPAFQAFLKLERAAARLYEEDDETS